MFRRLIEDCRVLSHLTHLFFDTLEYLDDWHHRERISESGTIRGLRLLFDSMFSRHPNQSATHPDELSHDPTATPLGGDPAQLAALIRKVDTPQYRKQSLLGMLRDLPMSAEIEGHILRLCAERSIQFEAIRILPTLPGAGPLCEALVFAERPARVAHALAELEDFGSAATAERCPAS